MARRKNPKRDKSESLRMFRFDSRFADLDPEILGSKLADIGEEKATEFTKTLANIQKEIGNVNPLCILSFLAAYGLSVAIGKEGISSPSRTRRILPSHVELLQALYLIIPADELSENPSVPYVTEPIFDQISECSENFVWKRLSLLQLNQGEKERHRLLVQERIRMATQVLRNWAHHDQVKKLGQDFARPLDDEFRRCHGFTGTAVISVFSHMLQEWEERLNVHWIRLSGLALSKTLEGAVKAYCEAFPNIKDSSDQLVAEMRARQATREQAVSMLMSHADLLLPGLGIFSAKDIADSTKVPLGEVDALLNSLSLTFGDLGGRNVEHFFLDNPVWTKPAIKLGEETYFCVMPQLFFSFLFETFQALSSSDSRLKRAYERRRSVFLETKSRELLERAFPTAQVIANFEWSTSTGAQRFESDLIVQVQSFLLLVEVKSGHVPPAARRGADGSLRRAIEELLVQPSRQSQRLEKSIREAIRGVAGTRGFRRAFPIRLSRISKVLRLSITLEDMAFMQSNVNALKNGGYVQEDLAVAPTVMLSDLEVVFEILESEADRIHYLIQRSDWDGRVDYLADELDLLGTYLKTRLNLDSEAIKDRILILVGASEHIDNFIQCRAVGVNFAKPRASLTKWWRDILKRLEAVKGPNWLEAAVIVTSSNIEMQEKFEKEVHAISKRVRRRREGAASENSLVLLPRESRSEALAVLALTSQQFKERKRLIQELVDRVYAEHSRVTRCAVIVLDVDHRLDPYNTFAWSSTSGIDTVSPSEDA